MLFARSPNTAAIEMILVLVVLRRAGAVRIDVVDVVRRQAGIAMALLMQPMVGLPSGAERVRWKRVRHLAAALDHAEDLRAARLRVLRGFRAPARRRLPPSRSRRGSSRTASTRPCGGSFEVESAESSEKRISDFGVHRAVGADAQRRVGLAAPDRLDAELDRGRAGRAGGRERDRRALGAELLGEPVGDRAEQETLVVMLEAAGLARARQVVVAQRLVRARGARDLVALLPFDLDRRDAEEQRARESRRARRCRIARPLPRPPFRRAVARASGALIAARSTRSRPCRRCASSGRRSQSA